MGKGETEKGGKRAPREGGGGAGNLTYLWART